MKFYVFDLESVFKDLNAKGKRVFFVILEKFRSFGAKWVRMVGKIKLCKGLFCKKKVLTFKPL
jgi:hypothetical protein